MSETTKWSIGGPISGGSVPTQFDRGPFCGRNWPYTLVTEPDPGNVNQVVAVVPAAMYPSPPGVQSKPIPGSDKKRAALIVAAPRLVEALAWLIRDFEQYGKNPVRDLDEAMEFARFALALARGETAGKGEG